MGDKNRLMIEEFDGESFIFWKDRVERIKSSKLRKIQAWNTLNNVINDRSKSEIRKQRVHGIRLTLMNHFDIMKDED
jgi:hypothetical protein